MARRIAVLGRENMAAKLSRIGAVILVSMCIVLSGCTRTPVEHNGSSSILPGKNDSGEPVSALLTVKPEPIYKSTYGIGRLMMSVTMDCVSPDGRYILVPDGSDLVALPLKPDVPKVTLLEFPEGEFWDPSIRSWVIRWDSPTTCVYLVGEPVEETGAQGNASGRRVTLYRGDVETGLSTALVSLDASDAKPYPSMVGWNREIEKLYVHANGSIMEMDANSGSYRTIRSGLPNWKGRFRVVASPTARHIAYFEPIEPSTSVVVLDTSSGIETPLHDETSYSFCPTWSPNGRYLVAPLAARSGDATERSDSEETGSEQSKDGPTDYSGYEVMDLKGYPALLTKALIIYDTETETSRVIELDDKLIFGVCTWSPNSRRIFFTACSAASRKSDYSGEYIEHIDESLWSVDIENTSDTAFKISDFSGLPEGASATSSMVMFSSYGGEVAFANVSEKDLVFSVWAFGQSHSQGGTIVWPNMSLEDIRSFPEFDWAILDNQITQGWDIRVLQHGTQGLISKPLIDIMPSDVNILGGVSVIGINEEIALVAATLTQRLTRTLLVFDSAQLRGLSVGSE